LARKPSRSARPLSFSFRVQVRQLVLRRFQAAGGDAVLPLQQGHDGRHGLQVPPLQQLLQEAAQLGDACARALAPVQAAVEAALQLRHVRGLPVRDGRAEVFVGPEDGVLAVADPAGRDGPVGDGWWETGERKEQ